MGRGKAKSAPRLQYHRATGQGRVHLGGRDFYCGVWGTPECKARFDQLVGEWLLNGRQPPRQGSPGDRSSAITNGGPVYEEIRLDPAGNRGGDRYSPAPVVGQGFLVCEIAARYIAYSEVYHRDRSGKPTTTKGNVKQAVVALAPYDDLPAAAFGPRKLQEMRELLVQQGRPRRGCNTIVKAVKRLFKWAESQELVPRGTSHALATVEPLKAGRTRAPELPPVKPVPDELIEQTLPHLTKVVADMVRIQRLTGARPGEVCDMRPCDFDRDGDVWDYRPRRHKTQYREDGTDKVIPIGPRAQEILLPYLQRDPHAHCFSPQESEELRHLEMRRQRKSPVQPSQRNRRKRNPQRAPRECYTTDSYRRAITRATVKASVKSWTPHQIRHTAATAVRKQFGLEAAQATLGHKTADVTQIYAERNHELARKVAAELG